MAVPPSPETPEAARLRVWAQRRAREIRKRLDERWGPAWGRLVSPEVRACVLDGAAAQVVLSWDEETCAALPAMRAVESIRAIVEALAYSYATNSGT